MSGEGGRGLTATPVALWLGWLLWLWQGFSLTWENSAKSEILAHHSAGNSGSQNPRRRRRCMKISLAVCPYISKGEKKKVRVRRILARHFFPPGAGKPRALLAWACCGGMAVVPQWQRRRKVAPQAPELVSDAVQNRERSPAPRTTRAKHKKKACVPAAGGQERQCGAVPSPH